MRLGFKSISFFNCLLKFEEADFKAEPPFDLLFPHACPGVGIFRIGVDVRVLPHHLRVDWYRTHGCACPIACRGEVLFFEKGSLVGSHSLAAVNMWEGKWMSPGSQGTVERRSKAPLSRPRPLRLSHDWMNDCYGWNSVGRSAGGGVDEHSGSVPGLMA